MTEARVDRRRRAEPTNAVCPVCGSSASRQTRVQLSYGAIAECHACGSGLLEPRPGPGQLASLHGNDDYFNHPYFLARRELSPQVRAGCEKKLSRVERVLGSLSGKTLVDVGCDLGVLVAYAGESRQMKTIGIDIFERVVELGRGLGRDLRAGTLESVGLAGDSADIICGFDLIEHVDNPHAFAREAFRVLKPGGALVLETPNYRGMVYGVGRMLAALPGAGRWLVALQERLWPPFHVQYFTQASLEKLLAGAGFNSVLVEGRELENSELVISNPLILAGVRLATVLGRVTSATTLLSAIAQKPRAEERT